uniref:Ring finger protein, putative n=1 Tax=Arundo donax TaxID=35708 RepID=A0A0A9GGC3_ARUDO
MSRKVVCFSWYALIPSAVLLFHHIC